MGNILFIVIIVVVFGAEPDEWNGMVKKVLKMDNSWNNAAGKYIDVYNSVRVRYNN